jgi:hypothetical protein
MQWLAQHVRLIVGILADLVTFVSGLLFARDAFVRLKELNEARISERFQEQFPGLNMADPAAGRARMSKRWALRGLVLLGMGFVLQIVTRFLDR